MSHVSKRSNDWTVIWVGHIIRDILGQGGMVIPTAITTAMQGGDLVSTLAQIQAPITGLCSLVYDWFLNWNIGIGSNIAIN